MVSRESARRCTGVVGLLAALAISVACGVPRRPGATAPAARGSEPRQTARALLLFLADRQSYEPYTVELVLGEHPELHAELALALARIGDERGAVVLRSLLRSENAEARRAAAFGLGLLGGADSTVDLLVASLDPDRDTGRLAVEALARLETPLSRLVATLEGLPGPEADARLLPSLFRFDPEQFGPVAKRALASDDPSSRRWAAYATARKAVPAAAPALRDLLAETDPWIRGWAARGLGSVGDASDLPRLLALLADPEAGPTIQALRAARSLVAAGKAAPEAAWVPELARLLDDSRPGVRMTAVTTAGAWRIQPVLVDVLTERAATARRGERQAALLALAASGDERAVELARRASIDRDPVTRASAAAAAGLLGASEVLDRLILDAVPGVRLAALSERIGDAEEEATADHVRLALADEDEAVRATALDWLAENPVVEIRELTLAFSRAEAGRLIDLPLGLVRALAARAAAEPLERGAIVAALEALARDPELQVRRAAVEALVRLDRPASPVGTAETGSDLRHYRQQVVASDRPRWVELATEAGVVTIRLECPVARLTCLNLLQLVNQGFYDGLTFHRVVPDFVVQGGDPRGDGWGGPGYTVRDESNLLRFERGTIGMALSGPHTAGSQFFIALAPQPHLDGTFTAFGRVVAEDEVLDRIVQGDRIERMVEVSGPPATPAAVEP